MLFSQTLLCRLGCALNPKPPNPKPQYPQTLNPLTKTRKILKTPQKPYKPPISPCKPLEAPINPQTVFFRCEERRRRRQTRTPTLRQTSFASEACRVVGEPCLLFCRERKLTAPGSFAQSFGRVAPLADILFAVGTCVEAAPFYGCACCLC